MPHPLHTHTLRTGDMNTEPEGRMSAKQEEGSLEKQASWGPDIRLPGLQSHEEYVSVV